jgi:exopolysaccharide biosynthesis operon protein EpsL
MKMQNGLREAVTGKAGIQSPVSGMRRAPMRTLQRLVGILAAAMAMAPCAQALPGDQVEFFVGETVVRDNNVFRISSDLDPATILGESEKGDTRTTTSAGVTFDVPVSRQRFQGGVTLNDNRYGRFSDLNYTDRDVRALWLWQVGDPVSGQLGFSDTKSLSSFMNFQGRIANPFEIRRGFGHAAWMVTPSWRLQAGLALQEQRNGLERLQENDLNLRSPDVTLSYITQGNNSVGLSLRQDNGDYLYQQVLTVSGTPISINNDYRQQRIGVVADWTITGESHIDAHADRVSRRYEQVSQRNYDGTTLYANYELKMTGKFSMSAVAQREISMGEDIQTSLVLVKGFALRPSLYLTEKIRLSANADYSVRDYLCDPAVQLGTAPSRSDRVRILSATVSYRPLQSLTLSLMAQRERRSSNLLFGDYNANLLNFSARLSF